MSLLSFTDSRFFSVHIRIYAFSIRNCVWSCIFYLTGYDECISNIKEGKNDAASKSFI